MQIIEHDGLRNKFEENYDPMQRDKYLRQIPSGTVFYLGDELIIGYGAGWYIKLSLDSVPTNVQVMGLYGAVNLRSGHLFYIPDVPVSLPHDPILHIHEHMRDLRADADRRDEHWEV